MLEHPGIAQTKAKFGTGLALLTIHELGKLNVVTQPWFLTGK